MTDVDRLLSVSALPDGDDRVVVEVVGELDAYTAPLLELLLESQAAQPGLRELVVDLGSVTFLGAAGMSVLAQANQRCREAGARFVVRTGGRCGVVRPLRLAGLAAAFAVDPAQPELTGDGCAGRRTGPRPRPVLRRPPVSGIAA
jgi:anti-anti-sigma factor